VHDPSPPDKPVAAAKPDPLIGGRLGDYEIRRQIARGGMARVYEGYDPGLDRRAAIKVIDIAGADPTEAREITERFFREARQVANLDHPNIVTVYQFGEFAPQYFMAMKYLEGRTLQEALKRLRSQKRLMPPDQILSVADDVAAALDYAHGQGVIHRDVKPSNIMLTPNGRAILMDFGLLMEFGKDNTLGTAFGTPRYIAPEQAVASSRAVPQSDIYAFGVVVYEMICGQTPFDGTSAMELALAHMSNPPPPLRSINPDTPPSVEAVVLRALDKTPEVRWRSASAFVAALRQAYTEPAPNLPDAEPMRAAGEQTDLTPILVNREALLSAAQPPVIQSPIPAGPQSETAHATPVPSTAALPKAKPAKAAKAAKAAKSTKTTKAVEAPPAPEPKPDPEPVVVAAPPPPVVAPAPVAEAKKTREMPPPPELAAKAEKAPRRSKAFWPLAVLIAALVGFVGTFAALPPDGQPATGASVPRVFPPTKAVRLVYSEDGLAILNVGLQAIPLNSLSFSPDGRTYVPAIRQGELAPGACAFLRAASNAPIPTPLCKERQVVRAASLFWQRPDMFFVSWEKQTFRCGTDVNTCEIRPE